MLQNLQTHLHYMTEAAIKASRKIVRDFGELDKLQVSKKGLNDFVTKSDLKSEEIICSILSEFTPNYGILSEERGGVKAQEKNGKEYRWIIDPLDGTMNFMHAIPFFAVSIALEELDLDSGNREIIAGVTSLPMMQEIYYASKNSGAWVEKLGHVSASGQKERLRVSQRSMKNDLLSAIGTSEIAGENRGERALKMVKDHQHIRNFGATTISLAFLAAGKIDLYFQHQENLWDVAAGIIIIREAGGMLLDFKGSNFDLSEKYSSNNKYDIMATNINLYKDLQRSDFFD